nr:MAM domain-containing glycosylphosphatidylinositol anchor protein 1-like [Procambarus clarkii]
MNTGDESMNNMVNECMKNMVGESMKNMGGEIMLKTGIENIRSPTVTLTQALTQSLSHRLYHTDTLQFSNTAKPWVPSQQQAMALSQRKAMVLSNWKARGSFSQLSRSVTLLHSSSHKGNNSPNCLQGQVTFTRLRFPRPVTVDFFPTVVSEDEESLPKFIENVPNITVTVGRDALLPCTVEQLKGFKVAWVQVDTQTILTIHKQFITRNPRIALLHNDHRTWHLELKNVREKDRGWYMCQINTDPMRYRQGYVDVVVPPDIIDRESSGDLTIREGQDVTLTCRAKGHPTPSIVWRREDNQDIVLDTEKTGDPVIDGTDVGAVGGVLGDVGGRDGVVGAERVVEGETLHMRKVSRLQMGSYLCIASNGIPPSISKRTQLRVQFPPVAWVPQQLEGAYLGQELTIECHTEAFPKSINYWTNTNGDMIVADDRYEPIVAESSYKVYMKLRIRRVEAQDIGTFRCIAKNSLGETDGVIRVYEIEPPKAHSNGVFGAEEGEVDSGDGPPPTATHHHNKERNKYENYLHPKGINDLNDQHRHSKPNDAKESGHRSTAHHGRRPNYGSSAEHDSATCLLSSSATTVSLTLTALLAHWAARFPLAPHL